MIDSKPTTEHKWLEQLLGDWTYEVEGIACPDQPPHRSTGSERVRALGGFWVLADGDGQMPCDGGPAKMLLTLGYDPRKQRYVGTWVGSMMPLLWTYEGTLDASGKVLTLEAEGPTMADPTKTTRYRDIIEIKDADHRLMTSRMLGEDGKWIQFMAASYRRAR